MAIQNDDNSAEALPGLDLVFEQVERRLEFQFRQIDSLDTKLSIVAGFGGVILAATIGSFPDLSPFVPASFSFRVVVLEALIAVTVSVIVALIAYRVRGYEFPPEPRGLRMGYIHRSPEAGKLAIIDSRIVQFEANQDKIHQKVRRLGISLWTLLAG